MKKKTMCDSLFGKDIYVKTKSGSGGQITYWKGTVVSCSILLSSYTYGLY